MAKCNLDEQQVIDMYLECRSARVVAEHYGVSNETIRRVLKRNNVPRVQCLTKKHKTHMPSNCNTRYCHALVGMLVGVCGFTTSQVRDATGIPINSVCGILRRNFPDLKAKKDKARENLLDAIEQEYLSGASTYELGEKYGISHATISTWMCELGHVRGKSKGPAFERECRRRREEADAKLISEFGYMPKTGKNARKSRRRLRMALRHRDIGVTWKALAKRNGNLFCEVCGIECDPDDRAWGSHGPTHPSVDHIVRIVDGGEDTFENSRLVCFSCNLKLNVQAEKEVKAHAKEQAAAYKCA